MSHALHGHWGSWSGLILKCSLGIDLPCTWPWGGWRLLQTPFPETHTYAYIVGLTSETPPGSVMGSYLWSGEWEQTERYPPSVLFLQRVCSYRDIGQAGGKGCCGRGVGGQGESLKMMVTSGGGVT